MTHPDPKAPGNVPLWSCLKENCLRREGHCGRVTMFKINAARAFLVCYDRKAGTEAVVVGFRTPPDCHYCIHVQSASQCAKCENKDNYTPRQPGKGGAA